MRLFVAILIEDALRREMAQRQERLKGRLRGARISWVAPENFHITMRFLGEQSDEELPAIEQALFRATNYAPFEAKIGGWGVFPNPNRPSVIWIGTESNAHFLTTLADMVELRLQEKDFEREPKPFHSHLTVARVKAPMRGLAEAFASIEASDLGTVQVNDIALMRSELSPQGARYAIQARFPLKPQEELN